MNRTIAIVVAFVIWTGLAFGAGWAWRADRADLTSAKRDTAAVAAVVEAVQDARETEHTRAETSAEIGAEHEQKRAEAEAVPDAVVAELRAGNIRMREQWQACASGRATDAVSTASERDAAAFSREQAAGRVIRIGRDADDQLRACQAVVTADRGL